MNYALRKSGFNYWIVYPVLLVLSALFIFLFSRGTSSFYNFYGHDSAIFITMGQALLDGKVPYVDFFDHKGPMLIFINALGQLFVKGREGIFLIQIVNLSVVLLFLYKISRLFSLSVINTAILIFTFLLFFRFTITEGNLTEEYTLPFIFISIYLTFGFYFKNKSLDLPDAALLGLCFFVPFWIRANNVGLIIACIIFIIYILLKEKRYKSLKKFIVGFLLTIFALSVVLFGYFIYKGAFGEMIYSSFLFNLKYARISDLILPKYARYYTIFIIAAVFFLCLGVAAHYKKNRDKNVLVFALLCLVFGIMPLLLTGIDRLLLHYMALTIPITIAGLLFLLISLPKSGLSKSKYGVSVIIVLILLLVISIRFRYDKVKHIDDEYVIAVREICKNVPENQKYNTFTYHAPPSFYLVSGMPLTFRYFILQEFHARVDTTIFTDINKMMTERRPLWVFTGFKSAGKFKNKELCAIIEENYYLVERKEYNKNEFLTLYRLKEDTPIKK